MDEPITKACRRCGVVKPETPEHYRFRFYPNLGKALYAHVCTPCSRQPLQPRPEGTKKCRACGEYKPLNADHFRPNGKATPTGTPTYRPKCRTCERKHNPPQVSDGMRWCRKCGRVKPHTMEYFYLIREGGQELSATCRTCNKQAYQDARARDPELMRQKRRAQMVRRFEKDPELFRQQRRARCALRRSRKRAVEQYGNYTAQDVRQKWLEQGGRCYWCGCELQKTGKDAYHVDHIWPLAKGGTNAANNICCSCRNCNQSKCARTPLDFAGRLF